MKQHIYGLTGFASVGKDTIADLLVTHVHFRKLAFADALRAEVSSAFDVGMAPLTHAHLKGIPLDAFAMKRAPSAFVAAVALALRIVPDHAWLDEPRSPRQILQWWGTEYRRAQDPRYWTRRLLERVVYHQRDGELRFVITDCRFANEVDTLLSMGGELWQITRPGIDATTTAEGQHVSATSGALFKPSTVICNSHDLKHLQQLVLSEFVSRETGVPSAWMPVYA